MLFFKIQQEKKRTYKYQLESYLFIYCTDSIGITGKSLYMLPSCIIVSLIIKLLDSYFPSWPCVHSCHLGLISCWN